MTLDFTVPGIAVPQGSMVPFIDQASGQARVKSDNPKLARWRRDVATAARTELWCRPRDQRQLLAGPVLVRLRFWLPRPKSLPKRVVEHVTKPDLDKLVRAVFDALTGVVWVDDNQVVRVDARKRYEVAGGPHVEVSVGRLALEESRGLF